MIVHDFGICVTSTCGPSCDHREPPAEEIAICRAWLRDWAVPRASFNGRASSYELKHAVERASRRDDATAYRNVDRQGREWWASRVYVSNGAFIRAAVLEGYSMKQCREASPNAFFNLSVQKLPASERACPVVVTAAATATALSSPARAAVSSLSRVTGSVTRTAALLGVSIGTLDRAMMGLRLKATTIHRIVAAVERRTVHEHEVIQ